MQTIKFKKNYSPYVEGDIAGFSDEETEKLLEQDIAERFEVPEELVSEQV